jgi:pyruvate kinase
MNKLRRTKIVATIGPATDRLGGVEDLVKAGVDVFRCNFSHGTQEDHKRRIKEVRKIAHQYGHEVAIFADLQGPKIRLARFKKKKIHLKENAEFILDAALADDAGDEKKVGIEYKDLPKDVSAGDILLLDDGRLVFEVEKVKATKVFCRVAVGGELSNNKGINRQGGGLTAKALTSKDKDDLKFAAKLDVDYFAISFPRSAKDIEEAKKLIKKAGSAAGVIAKIERAEAVEAIDEIIRASSAVMVARGDLGVEIGDAELPAVQKHVINRARELNKPVITATQMMETMIHSQMPTRAEVFDVANAVMDTTDAVMLSAETASGDHPKLVVETMVRICLGAEKQLSTKTSSNRVECHFDKIDESIAMSAMYIANHLDIKAVIALTESGSTPLLMSRIQSGIPIFALTRNRATERKMHLYRSVHPIDFDLTKVPVYNIDRFAVGELKKRGHVKNGDLILITKGDILGELGHTNTMRIHRVGEDV